MNIIVTGASRGIGYELVRQLSAHHRVMAISRNAEKLNQLKEACIAVHPQALVEVLSLDLSTPSFAKQLVPAVTAVMPLVDIIINNAGLLINKPMQELTRTDLLQMYQVNVFGVFELIQAIVPYMNAGHIVNIGSMGGFQGSAKFPGLSGYSSSKGAVACLSECLAEELKETGIKVNCLALGAAQTEMLAEAFPGYEAPVSAKEMANYIADFAVNAHKYLNGKVIPVALSTP